MSSFAAGSKRMLQAGVARMNITPPLGIRMMGYTVQECISESVERELTATALVLSDGSATVLLIACDLLFIQSPYVDRIRDRVGETLGISADAVLINCSHTHLGPMLPGWQADSPEQQERQQSYLASLEESLVRVAVDASSCLQPARIGAAEGFAPIGVNRRERLPEGGVMIGENPEGAVDRAVHVIRVDALTGESIATVMSAAAHTVILGPATSQLSPDYVGPARELVESTTGAPSLFLQGAAGNVNPSCSIGGGGPEQYDDLRRVGAMLGGEVLRMWGQIRTHNRHGSRRVVRSVAAISVWDYEPVPEATVEHFGVESRRVTLPLASLPTRTTAEQDVETYRKKLAELEKNDAPLGAVYVARRFVHWAENVLQTIEAGEDPPRREISFTAFRVNDTAIASVSGEPFAELGLEVKRRSPFAHTIFLGYTNGCIGYLPTPEAFDEGGMEVHESYQNYLLPCPFTKEWGPAVIRNALELLNSLR
jgi:neutral ceramidase